MLYYMPQGMTGPKLGDWINAHAYDKDCDDNQLFKYLYLIFYEHIRRKKAFVSQDDIEACSIFAATEIYYRYKSPRKKPNDDGTFNRPIIQNIYGYAKAITRFLIYMYKQKFWGEYSKQNPDDLEEVQLVANYGFNESLCRRVNLYAITDVFVSLECIPATIKAILNTTPYKKGSSIYNNLYISCMLTFLNGIVFTDTEEQFIKGHTQTYYKEKKYFALLDSSKLVEPKIFNLEPYMRDYVVVLVRRCRTLLKRDLEELIYSQIDVKSLCNDLLNNIVGGNEWEQTDD